MSQKHETSPCNSDCNDDRLATIKKEELIVSCSDSTNISSSSSKNDGIPDDSRKRKCKANSWTSSKRKRSTSPNKFGESSINDDNTEKSLMKEDAGICDNSSLRKRKASTIVTRSKRLKSIEKLGESLANEDGIINENPLEHHGEDKESRSKESSSSRSKNAQLITSEKSTASSRSDALLEGAAKTNSEEENKSSSLRSHSSESPQHDKFPVTEEMLMAHLDALSKTIALSMKDDEGETSDNESSNSQMKTSKEAAQDTATTPKEIIEDLLKSEKPTLGGCLRVKKIEELRSIDGAAGTNIEEKKRSTSLRSDSSESPQNDTSLETEEMLMARLDALKKEIALLVKDDQGQIPELNSDQVKTAKQAAQDRTTAPRENIMHLLSEKSTSSSSSEDEDFHPNTSARKTVNWYLPPTNENISPVDGSESPQNFVATEETAHSDTLERARNDDASEGNLTEQLNDVKTVNSTPLKMEFLSGNIQLCNTSVHDREQNWIINRGLITLLQANLKALEESLVDTSENNVNDEDAAEEANNRPEEADEQEAGSSNVQSFKLDKYDDVSQ